MLLRFTSESEANLVLQIALERMFGAYQQFKTMTSTAIEQGVFLRHMAQEIGFQNEVISTIHFSQWLCNLEPFSNDMRIFFTRCLRRDAQPIPLPKWDDEINLYFHHTNGSNKFRIRHVDPWWNRMKDTELKLKFNVKAMIEKYTVVVPILVPDPVNYIDVDLAVEQRILWLISKLPDTLDGKDVLEALESLQYQFDSNRQSCALRLSGVKRTFEQAYSLE